MNFDIALHCNKPRGHKFWPIWPICLKKLIFFRKMCGVGSLIGTPEAAVAAD